MATTLIVKAASELYKTQVRAGKEYKEKKQAPSTQKPKSVDVTR